MTAPAKPASKPQKNNNVTETIVDTTPPPIFITDQKPKTQSDGHLLALKLEKVAA